MEFIRQFLTRTTIGAVLILPIFLTHFRGIADGLISYIAVCFLIYSFIQQDWEWTRKFWVMIAALWWVWLIICTIPFGTAHYTEKNSLLQSLVMVRFLVFAVALQVWVLADVKYRRWLAYILAGCVAYIILQMLSQLIIGYNFFGQPRYFDGTLTGPYPRPRAAAPLSRLLLPVTLAVGIYIIHKIKGWKGQILSFLALLFACAILTFAGQRMPFFLFVFGLAISLFWLRSLRPIASIMVIAIPSIVLITAFVAPRSFHHLITHFIDQLSHFSSSPYGLIYVRALVMSAMNPWAGLGYDAFRYACANPLYFHGWPFWEMSSGDGGGAVVCVYRHPHNHYLQAVIDGGIPSLMLFITLIVAWLKELARGIKFQPTNIQDYVRQAWCVGIFAAVFIHEWPFAAASDFLNMPLGGWFFLLLGMGLAYSEDVRKKQTEQLRLKQKEQTEEFI